MRVESSCFEYTSMQIHVPEVRCTGRLDKAKPLAMTRQTGRGCPQVYTENLLSMFEALGLVPNVTKSKHTRLPIRWHTAVMPTLGRQGMDLLWFR